MADWVAMDTEADSLHAYPEKLCLVQISHRSGDDLIDPLSRINLQPLWSELARHELILHGADYDLRLLRKSQGFVPHKIFDTMLAARLIRAREFGLNHLVQQFLGITLEKGSQKANWARRPLTERMEEYARNDTRHLKPLSDRLREELQNKGRLSWHEETCAQLVAECAVTPAIDADAVWRIKGSTRLSRPALAILRELWNWREQEAIQANTPPFFVLPHEVMTGLADAVARGQVPDGLIPQRLSPNRRKLLEQAIERGLQAAPGDHPRILEYKVHHPDAGERQRFDAIQKRRDQRAAELGIDPTLIASRATLALLAQDPEHPETGLMNWQRALLEMNSRPG